MQTPTRLFVFPLLSLVFGLPVRPSAQTPTSPAGTATQASAASRQSGTVKAVTPNDLVLTNAAGQDIAVTLPSSVKVSLVDPTTRDVKNAQPGTVSDIAGGDKAIVIGTAGDAGSSMTASRVLLLKSGAIAAMHAQQQAAWARSVGGLVKAVDPATGTLTVVNGARTFTVNTSPNTVVRRYTAGSVRFEDAVSSNVGAIQPGDQVQARGQRSPDGATVTADEIVTGSFSNFSGILTAVDTGAGTVTLKDLATKKPVTVAITGQTNLRKMTPGLEQGGGSRPGTSGAPGAARDETGAPRSGGPPQGAPVASGSRQSDSGAGASARSGASRIDLSRIIDRLPTETAADLKPGDAVMIVASNNGANGRPTAITLLSGVERILASSPAGQTTLSPWSLGGGEGAGAGGGEPGGGGQ